MRTRNIMAGGVPSKKHARRHHHHISSGDHRHKPFSGRVLQPRLLSVVFVTTEKERLKRLRRAEIKSFNITFIPPCHVCKMKTFAIAWHPLQGSWPQQANAGRSVPIAHPGRPKQPLGVRFGWHCLKSLPPSNSYMFL